MDRESFKILDQGYQEDKQRLIDRKTEEISPGYDEQLKQANQNYIQRLWNIRHSNYTHMERQRIEQQELEAFEARQSAIEAEREEVLQQVIAEDDTQLQMILFEGRMREEVEAQLKAQEEEHETSNQPSTEETSLQSGQHTSNFNEVSGDSADVSDFANVPESETTSSLSGEFADTTQADATPPAKGGEGIEP